MNTEDTGFGSRLVRIDDLETLRGAADLIGVTVMTVRAWVQADLLPSFRLGNCVVVCISDVLKVNEEMLERGNYMSNRTKGDRQYAS